MSVISSEIIFGIDYRSNIHLFDFEKEKKHFNMFMSNNLRITKEKLSDLISLICNKYEIGSNDVYRLDNYFKALNCLCYELNEDYEAYEDSVYGLYLTPLRSLIYCKEVRTNEDYITNMVVGMNLYTLLKKDKEEYKSVFESIYNHFAFILRDDVTVLDIMNNCKYHSIIQDEYVDYDIHLISSKL